MTRGLSKLESPLTRNTLAVWDRKNKTGKYAPCTSPLAPLGGYPWFPPGEEGVALGPWGSDRNTMFSRYAPNFPIGAGIISGGNAYVWEEILPNADFFFK